MHIEMGRRLDGAARQVAYLLNGLEKHPGEHSLVCASGSEISGAISNREVKVSRIKQAETRGLKLLKALRKIIRYDKPDLIHIHNRPGDFMAVLAAKLEKKAMVYSIRTDKRPSLFDRFVKFPFFGKIIAQSQAINRVLQLAHVPDDRLTCIPGAVDSERFKPDKEGHGRATFLAQFALRGDGPVLVMASQWATSKGHAVLFGALPAILAKNQATRVLIFGQGPEKVALEKEVKRRGLEKFVRFVGFRPDLEHILPYADLFIHPALSEGMGVVLMEAAACGVPIIASRVGGIPEIVRDRFNGYLVKSGDSINLARHIIDLLADDFQFKAFGKTGRELAVENFSIEKMVTAHRYIYRNV